MRHTNYPFARALDADGGGAADLQTDVMRFMAIISMCLVAIFALVQSIPAEVSIPSPAPAPVPAPDPPAPPVVQRPEPVAETKPIVDPEIEVVVPEPVEPIREPVQQMVTTVPEPVKPVPNPVEEVRVTVPEPPPPVEPSTPTQTEERKGFTLRFASDQALTALVAREDIGFYAIRSSGAHRMQYDRGRVEFWQASVPKQYHEMHASTVPDAVQNALRRSGQSSDVTWGVTLPSRLSRELNRYLSRYSGGDLVIAANGTMTREE